MIGFDGQAISCAQQYWGSSDGHLVHSFTGEEAFPAQGSNTTYPGPHSSGKTGTRIWSPLHWLLEACASFTGRRNLHPLGRGS